MRRSNAWHDAICTQLRAANEPLTVRQIWTAIASSSFQHRSKHPRQTLTARIAELVQMKKVGRVRAATYRLMDVECHGCKHHIPWSRGSDDLPQHCDDCWAKAHPELIPAGAAATETYTR